MEIFQGKEGFGSVALGTIRIIRKTALRMEGTSPIDDELSKYETAKKRAAQILKDESRTTQLMILEDHQLDGAIVARILNQGCSASAAVTGAGKYIEEVLARQSDSYLSSKSADIKHISKLLLSCMDGYAGGYTMLFDECIVAADTMSTSELLKLDREKLKGLVVESSSGNSHTAILAKAMGIPMIIGCEIKDEWDGQSACIDGGWRALYISPDEKTVSDMKQRMDEDRRNDEALRALLGQQCITRDGVPIHLFANVSTPEEAEKAIENGAEGVGLYRTERSYINRENPPTEDELFEEYRKLASVVGKRECVVRTADLSAGRDVSYLPFYGPSTPLGLRGIRLSLKYPEIFKAQVRAVQRAAVFGNLCLMLPMVCSVQELLDARRIIDECSAALKSADIPCKNVKLGVMLETPASVMITEQLAKNCDFFSIGTNDLTQYTLCVDRDNKEMTEYCDYHHPAVMSMIKMAAEKAFRSETPIGICGELASDEKVLPQFIDMCVVNYSLVPSRLLSIRKALMA